MKLAPRRVLILMLLALILFQVGCSTSKPQTTSPAAPTPSAPSAAESKAFDWKQFSGQQITILMNQHPFTTQIKPKLPEFEALTGIKVNVLQYPEDQLRQKMLISLQAKSDEFDVYMSLKSREGLQYYNAGFYEVLDPYLKDASLTAADYGIGDFLPGPLAGERFNNELVGIPINVEGPVIFYNKELFSKYGAEVPKSMGEIAVAAKKIKDGSQGAVVAITLRGLPGALPYTFGNFIYNQGKTWLDGDKPNFQDPTRLNAIQLYADLAKNYGPPGVLQYNFYQSSALFAQGKAAMELDSSNEISTILDPKSSTVIGKVGVIPFPPGSGGSKLTQLQWGVSMSKFAKNKKPAWLFMQWATSRQMQEELAVAGIAPPRTSAWNSARFQATLDSPTKKEWADALKFIMSNANPDVGPPAEDQAQVRQIVGEMVGKVILGQMTAMEAAKEADAKLEPLVKK